MRYPNKAVVLSLPGSTAYMVAFLVERVVSLLLMKFLIQNVSVETFAIWTQIISVSGLINLLIMVRLDNALVAVLPRYQRGVRKLFFVTSFFLLACFSLLVLFLQNLFTMEISNFIFGDQKYAFLLLPVFLFSLSEAACYMMHAYLRVEQRLQMMSFLYFCRFGGRSVLLILVLGVFNLSLEDGLSIITSFGFLICLIGFFPGKLNSMRLDEFFSNWKRILEQSSSQLLVAVNFWFIGNLDRYVIIYFLTLHDMAAFAFLLGVSAPIALISTITMQSTLPALSKLFKDDFNAYEKSISKVFRVNVFLCLPCLAGFVALGPAVKLLIGSSDFEIDILQYFLAALMMTLFNLEQLLGGFLTTQQKSWDYLKATAIATPIFVILLVVMTFYLGVVGAFSARIITFVFVLVLMLKSMPWFILNQEFLKLFRYWSITAISLYLVLGGLFFFGVFSYDWVSFLLSLLVGVCFYFTLNKRYLKTEVLPLFIKEYTP